MIEIQRPRAADTTRTRRSIVATALAVAAALAFGWGCDSGSSPTEPAPPTGPGPNVSNAVFGAVGCSQTRDAVEGYRRVGGENSWAPGFLEDYGGGDLEVWANLSHPRWADFQAALDAYGNDTVIIWFQICVRERTNASPTSNDLMEAEIIADEIRNRAPNVTIYASPINLYVDPSQCDSIGPEGVEVTEAVADHLVMMGLAQPGPVVGPLDNGTTVADNCHANAAGKRSQGSQLMGFFDPLL